MKRAIYRCAGGEVFLPEPTLVLVDRRDGGNLIVTPSRDVWDRGELAPAELSGWCFLVAATATAMLETLPQLAGGCINYWDAGNWALNLGAEPVGVPKRGPVHRRLHMHLLGRSPEAASPSYIWGEAPKFPDFADRYTWAAGHEQLTDAECSGIVERLADLLVNRYGMPAGA